MMHKNIRQNTKIRFLLLFYLPLTAIFLFVFMALINASIDNSKVLFSENDFWFDKITKYAGTSKLINIAANENLNNIIDDIENPFEGNIDAEKEGKNIMF